MRIGIFCSEDNTTIDSLVASATRTREDGFASWWMPQIFGYESLSVLSIVGREVPDIALGTAVVPTYPRHPVTMAQLALTAQAASGGRLTLGIGLSHQLVIEGLLKMSFERPVEHMTDHLAVLLPLLRGENADHEPGTGGEPVGASIGLSIPKDIPAPDVLVAALGPRMLRLAGTTTGGTITWMTGPSTLAGHIVPSIRAAAEEAQRPEPRVVAALPVMVTDDPAAARERCGRLFQMYGFLPSYRAMLDREGAEGPGDVAIVGSAEEVRHAISSLAGVGVTEFVAVEFATPGGDEAETTREVLRSLL